MEKHGLNRIHIGHAAKTGGSFTKTYFGLPDSLAVPLAHGDLDYCSRQYVGTHLWYGLKRSPLYHAECMNRTLFMVAARTKMSWLKSATAMKCGSAATQGILGYSSGAPSRDLWTNCTSSKDYHDLAACVNGLPGEMKQSPNDWFQPGDFTDPNLHTILFDFAPHHMFNDLLPCIESRSLAPLPAFTSNWMALARTPDGTILEAKGHDLQTYARVLKHEERPWPQCVKDAGEDELKRVYDCSALED